MAINCAKLIKEYREKKFLAQSEFASLVDVSTPCVPSWENKTYAPTIKVKKILYELFIETEISVEKYKND